MNCKQRTSNRKLKKKPRRQARGQGTGVSSQLMSYKLLVRISRGEEIYSLTLNCQKEASLQLP